MERKLKCWKEDNEGMGWNESRWKHKFYDEEIRISVSKNNYIIERFWQQPDRLKLLKKIGKTPDGFKAVEITNKYMKEHDKC